MNRFARAPFAVAALLLAGCSEGKSADKDNAGSPEASAAPAVPPVAAVDYSLANSWLCRPGAEDACERDLTATSIAADGKMTKEAFAPNRDAPIDCFYIYPTASQDASPNSDIVPDDSEKSAASIEIARFGTACRLFAPMYRQVTASALKQMLAGRDPGADREMAFADVKAAWERYLAADNQGRGVVLIGNSQGGGLLTRLIATEIDGKPAEARLVSALLLGASVDVPATGAIVGGTFSHIPLCTSAESTGCVISYSAFRTEFPPPLNSLFGGADQAGMQAACVNPAELDGSMGKLKAALPAGFLEIDKDALASSQPEDIPGGLMLLSGQFSGTCVNQGGFSYLAIGAASDPADKRTSAIRLSDGKADGKPAPEWGLSWVDINLAQGNLVDIVKRQGVAWKAAQGVSVTVPPEFRPPH